MPSTCTPAFRSARDAKVVLQVVLGALGVEQVGHVADRPLTKPDLNVAGCFGSSAKSHPFAICPPCHPSHQHRPHPPPLPAAAAKTPSRSPPPPAPGTVSPGTAMCSCRGGRTASRPAAAPAPCPDWTLWWLRPAPCPGCAALRFRAPQQKRANPMLRGPNHPPPATQSATPSPAPGPPPPPAPPPPRHRGPPSCGSLASSPLAPAACCPN